MPVITEVFRVDATSLVTLELREPKEVVYVREEAVSVREDVVYVHEGAVPVREDVVSVSVHTLLPLSLLIWPINLCRLPKDTISSSLRSSV